MKKLLTLISIICFCSFLSAQTLEINGNVSSIDGAPAIGVTLFVVIQGVLPIDLIAITDDNGNYSFTHDLPNSTQQGCFEILMFDCTGDVVIESDCFSPGNTSFTINFLFCSDIIDDCFSFISIEYTDSTIITLNCIAIGQAPFTYVWSDGSLGASIMVDSLLEYCVTVTDADGCISESCVNPFPPDPCFVNIFEEYTFNSVILYAEGYSESDQITYLWNTGEFGESIEIVASGEYCVTLTDGLGCTSSDCKYIEVDSTAWPDCFAFIYPIEPTGTTQAMLAVEAYGVAPFSYVWSSGETTASINVVDPGVYCVIITDAEGCIFETCYDYFIWADCGVWIGCDPVAIGVELWAFGYGAEPIEYTWSTGQIGQGITVTQNGNYCVTMVDAAGCTSSACVDVELDGIVDCFAPIEIIEFNAYTQLTVNPANDGNYDFVWNTGDTTQTITVTESGLYCVEVFGVDMNCFFTTCVEVNMEGDFCWGVIDSEITSDSSATLYVYSSGIDITGSGWDSLVFSFEWSTGATTPTIDISLEGEYCVTVTNMLDSCSFDACLVFFYNDVPWQNPVFVSVVDEETGVVVGAELSVFSVLDDGSVEPNVDAFVETSGSGTFSLIHNLAQGNYIVLATPYASDLYIPTYWQNSAFWDEATILSIESEIDILGIEISMITITNVNGIGTIHGTVSIDNLVANDKVTDSRAGGPLADANVLLMQEGSPVGQVYSDGDGTYAFDNLPFGTYTVILEVPGHQKKSIEVTLTEDQPNATGVNLETQNPSTSTEEIEMVSELTLSPNPTSHYLNVTAYFKEASNIVYRLIDVNGKYIQEENVSVNSGKNALDIDVSELVGGLYYLVVQTANETKTSKFIKL